MVAKPHSYAPTPWTPYDPGTPETCRVRHLHGSQFPRCQCGWVQPGWVNLMRRPRPQITLHLDPQQPRIVVVRDPRIPA